MTADQPARRRLWAVWRAARRVAQVLRTVQDEQVRMWEAQWQASRTAVPETGPLTWVLTLDGHKLAGRHLPAPSDTMGKGTDDPASRTRLRRRKGAPDVP
jgi:hypothetical protein